METKVNFITVAADYTEQRIDNFIFAQFRKIPKSHIYRAIRKGEVRVNKKRVKAESRIQPGDVIRIPPLHVPKEESILLKPSQQWLKIMTNAVLYEDEGILAINKPSGIAVHGDPETYGVIEIMRALYPQCPHLELAHRIDKETSGCLLLAKKRSVLKLLHAAFRQGTVQKTYYALTLGKWKKSELHVEIPLKRCERQSGECIMLVDRAHGKASLTHFEVLDKFEKCEGVLVHPMTGRTHQIRVHAQYHGHPLAGDSKYGDASFSAQMKMLGLNRLFLHALRIKLTLPGHSQPLKIQAQLPQELSQVLKKLS